jgi:hypothetical protein
VEVVLLVRAGGWWGRVVVVLLTRVECDFGVWR